MAEKKNEKVETPAQKFIRTFEVEVKKLRSSPTEQKVMRQLFIPSAEQ